MTLRARIRVWLTATGVPLVVAEMETERERRDEPQRGLERPAKPEPGDGSA